MSIRAKRKKLHQWFRYYRRYEPWHLSTPGLEKAYNRWAHACNAKTWREARRRDCDHTECSPRGCQYRSE